MFGKCPVRRRCTVSGTGSRRGSPDGVFGRGPGGTDSVTANAPALNEFTTPEPGTTFTRVGVEACAGSEGFSANPLYFTGVLDDNTGVDAVLGGGDFQTLGLAPGGCVAGSIDFQVPDGRTLASIVLTGVLFDEIARWSTVSSVPVDMPLTPTSPPTASAVGEVVELANGTTAVVRGVTPGAAPRDEFVTPGEGEQFVEADVEICAGSEPYSVNPLYWLATMANNYTAGEELGAETLQTIEVASSQCVAGTVAFSVPAEQSPAYILLTDPLFDEVGRWAAAAAGPAVSSP